MMESVPQFQISRGECGAINSLRQRIKRQSRLGKKGLGLAYLF